MKKHINIEKTFNQYWFSQFRRFFGSSTVVFINPIRKISVAFFAFQALYDLGLNNWHSTSAIITRIEELMRHISAKDGRTCWDAYCDRIKRNKGDVSQKIFSIMVLLQSHYGTRLAEMNCCMDIMKTDSEIFIRLNTRSVKPVREKVRSNAKQERQKLSFWSRLFNLIVALLLLIKNILSGN